MMDDLISRQAMMKEFADFVRKSNNSDFAPTPTWNDAVSLVGSMPTADLSEYCDKLWKTAYERGKAEAHSKKGKWKEVQVVIGRDGDFTTKEYECEICGYRQYFPENYCGRCGTRMEE